LTISIVPLGSAFAALLRLLRQELVDLVRGSPSALSAVLPDPAADRRPAARQPRMWPRPCTRAWPARVASSLGRSSPRRSEA